MEYESEIDAAENEGMFVREHKIRDRPLRNCYKVVEAYISENHRKDLEVLRRYFDAKDERSVYIQITNRISRPLVDAYHESGIKLQTSRVVEEALSDYRGKSE